MLFTTALLKTIKLVEFFGNSNVYLFCHDTNNLHQCNIINEINKSHIFKQLLPQTKKYPFTLVIFG